MILTKLFTLSLFASTALASGATIIAAIDTISATTTSLDDTVTAWDGTLDGAAAIVALSDQLLADTEDGTTVANASDELSIAEAIDVATATNALATVVEAALDTIVDAKSKFDALGVSSVILSTLQTQKAATVTFSDAVIDKVPDALQSTAQTIVQPILDAFDEAIAAYS
ncbi:hydrophobic surface binding protein A-domain-containing protein [Dactylonectria macrodidyma]|uniref:Hydrophobic surface binding protein A-domain-containing protein n=1 Tax=Dactylonectria macrodidyma TaxID=307937 RepID=A0A9P9E184_9HYPO|nr:hydrophobic surface binding protein A-domain-containing protein [Dactylonectria macrodidyma]